MSHAPLVLEKRRAAAVAGEISVVDMDAVPDPPVSGRSRGYVEGIFARIKALPAGKAIKIPVPKKIRGTYIRAKLRRLAKEERRFLSSSRSADKLTWYFWLEPDGTARK